MISSEVLRIAYFTADTYDIHTVRLVKRAKEGCLDKQTKIKKSFQKLYFQLIKSAELLMIEISTSSDVKRKRIIWMRAAINRVKMDSIR